MSRCSGQCCKKFCLPFSPMQAEHFKRQLAIGKDVVTFEGEYGVARYGVDGQDIDTIVDMIQFIRMDYQSSQDGHARGQSAKRTRRKRYERIYHYTCKHFDGKNCTIYEARPQMCRDFPNGTTCTYRGCTLECPETRNLKKRLADTEKELQEVSHAYHANHKGSPRGKGEERSKALIQVASSEEQTLSGAP